MSVVKFIFQTNNLLINLFDKFGGTRDVKMSIILPNIWRDFQ